MENKVRVLYFVDNIEQGGIQQLILKIAKHIDRNKIEIEILTFDDGKKYTIEETLKDINYKIYKINGWIYKLSDYLKQAKELNKFFHEHNNYKIVHLHSSSKNYQVLKYAKKYNIPIRIAHSHSTSFQTNNKIKIILGDILKKRLIKYTTNFFACSKDAGNWLFGKKEDVLILKNAINISKYKYNENIRKVIRQKYGILEDDILCGSVVRVVDQKNHKFLLEIFKDVLKINNKYKLLIVGDYNNVLKKELDEYVNKFNMSNNIIFTGFKINSNEYLNAMDLFLFPSKVEGLGIALIEAQVNGLKCIVSENIPEEAKISENVLTVKLSDEREWINKIINIDKNRKNCEEQINNCGYNIKKMVNELQMEYIKYLTNKA